MIGSLIMIGVVILLALLAGNTVSRILVSPQKKKRLLIFFAVLVLGAAVGVWAAGVEYQASDTFRFAGCPLPVAYFHLENGHWVDYVTPAPPLNWVVNVIVIALLLLAPLNVVFRFPREVVQ